MSSVVSQPNELVTRNYWQEDSPEAVGQYASC